LNRFTAFRHWSNNMLNSFKVNPAEPVLFHYPTGSDSPELQISATTRFIIVDDSDVGRDMMELGGGGGPIAFEPSITQTLGGANKVIVAIGGPGELVRLMMLSAARPRGYSVVVDTALSRLSSWAQKAVEVRRGQQGLAILGPRYAVPPALRDRCAANPDIDLVPPRGVPNGSTLH
jgi:hypothetical protein